jgi:DNA polymerase-4/DNA polymerase V
MDGDGFFAGVEQALNPALRGKPVVTGSERGIIAAASYEAKALGVRRGLQLHEAQAMCPELIVLPSDYEAYSLYSQRMVSILRRFTPHVEEHSIDEAFADLAGASDLPPDAIAEALRTAVSRELGLTVSIGISLTKTLAKLCSKFRKPNGQTVVRREHVPLLLARTPVACVWGIGPASAEKLTARGIVTAADFIRIDEADVRRLLHAPGLDTWHELRGDRRIALSTQPQTTYDSMMKGHTFSPPSGNARLVFAEALRNMTDVLARLRRHAHLAHDVCLTLCYKDHTRKTAGARLPCPTSHDGEVAPTLRGLFDSLFEPGRVYRSTTVYLGGVAPRDTVPLDLFHDTPLRREWKRLDEAVDDINRRFGRRAVAPGTLLDERLKPFHPRDAAPERYAKLAVGETVRHLAIPRLTLPNPI